MNFKNMDSDDKPRERLIRYGVENLANEELLAILIKTGNKNYNVKEVSLKLLEKLGNIVNLREIGINTLTKVEGIGLVKAIELKAAVELGRRVYRDNKKNFIKIKSSNDIYELFKDILKNKKCLFVGTLNNSTVHPREIFKEAYLLSASKLICVHNHPSGDVSPSKQDINLTRMIKEVSVIHGIDLIDHIIIGRDSYYSFNDNDMLC